MKITRIFVVICLLILGSCSGCGKGKSMTERWKAENLEKIVDPTPVNDIVVNDKEVVTDEVQEAVYLHSHFDQEAESSYIVEL